MQIQKRIIQKELKYENVVVLKYHIEYPRITNESNNCSNFEIMYKKEIKYGDIIKCYYAEIENTSYVVTLKNAETGEICAIIKLYI
mgnify:CR=1 FL=1